MLEVPPLYTPGRRHVHCSKVEAVYTKERAYLQTRWKSALEVWAEG